MNIRPVCVKDADPLCEIYNYYVKNTIITFQETPLSVQEMVHQIEETTESYPWFVFDSENGITGYAYATKWKTRTAYRFSVESTVYLKPGNEGKGLGSELYRTLLDALCALKIHAVIGGIALPNPASVALHEKFGFHKIAQFEEVGYKFGKYIDVGYWERILTSH